MEKKEVMMISCSHFTMVLLYSFSIFLCITLSDLQSINHADPIHRSIHGISLIIMSKILDQFLTFFFQRHSCWKELFSNTLRKERVHTRSVYIRMFTEDSLKGFTTHKPNDVEINLPPVDFISHRVAEGSRSSWLQILGNQLIDHSPCHASCRYTNHKYYLL